MFSADPNDFTHIDMAGAATTSSAHGRDTSSLDLPTGSESRHPTAWGHRIQAKELEGGNRRQISGTIVLLAVLHSKGIMPHCGLLSQGLEQSRARIGLGIVLERESTALHTLTLCLQLLNRQAYVVFTVGILQRLRLVDLALFHQLQ